MELSLSTETGIGGYSSFGYSSNFTGKELVKETISLVSGYKSRKKSYTLNKENTSVAGERYLENEMKGIVNVESGDLKLKFKVPYNFLYTSEEGVFFYQIPELSLFGYGNDLSDMLNDFYENVVIDWKLYVKNDIEKLSEQAISLREKLLELLEEC